MATEEADCDRSSSSSYSAFFSASSARLFCLFWKPTQFINQHQCRDFSPSCEKPWFLRFNQVRRLSVWTAHNEGYLDVWSGGWANGDVDQHGLHDRGFVSACVTLISFPLVDSLLHEAPYHLALFANRACVFIRVRRAAL